MRKAVQCQTEFENSVSNGMVECPLREDGCSVINRFRVASTFLLQDNEVLVQWGLGLGGLTKLAL